MSSNENIFDELIKPYKNPLKDSGYSEALNYIAPTTNKKQKNRKRKIKWFNPPFSRNVKSNIGRTFLRLLSKNFSWNHTMHKIFNRNTVKISHSCLRNITSIISSHNCNNLSPNQKSFGCNCKVKNKFPFNGECQTPSTIYTANVVNDSIDEEKIYFGLADTTFKETYRNHIRDFKNEKYGNSTELAKYIWQLKRNNISFFLINGQLFRFRFILF